MFHVIVDFWMIDVLEDLFLENLWDALLSRDPARIHPAYASLDPDSQAAVVAHLRKMADEAGWHAEQRQSAAAALLVIEPG